MAAHAKWLSLCSVLGLQDGSAQEWWEWLCSCYSEPQRCYHTMEHIESMLEQLGRHCEGKIKNLSEVLLAIFFHDVIYDPKANDNEKQSADWSLTFTNELKPLKPSLSSVDPDHVHRMIMLTESHKTPAHHEGHEFGSDDEHYLLDLDMSILGQPWNVYERYAGSIRKEYSHIPHDDYCQRRAKVLKGFLKVHRIYCTFEFHSLYEESARNNVEKEITLLTSNMIP